VKVNLGNIDILKKHLSDIDHDFVRSMVWNELAHMVAMALSPLKTI